MFNKPARKEAKDPKTTPERLWKLYKQDKSLASSLASHPNAPSSLLEKLLQSHKKSVREAAAKHSNISPFFLFSLEEKCPLSILQNPSWPLWLVEEPTLIQQISEKTLQTFLRNPRFEKTLYKEFQRRYFPKKQTDLHSNQTRSNLPVKALLTHPYLRAWCAQQKFDLPLPTLERLAIDPHEEVRLKVVWKHSTTIPLLELLAKDPHEKVRATVAWSSKTPLALLEILAKDVSTYVRYHVACKEGTPIPLLKILAKDESDFVRSGVASNAKTPLMLLDPLVQDESVQVRCCLAGNRAVPITLLERLVNDENVKVRCLLAANNSIPLSLLKTLATDRNEEVRSAVVLNNSTPISLLEELAKDESERVQVQIVVDRRTPPPLAKFVAKNMRQGLRHEMASSWRTSFFLLYQLTKDTDPLVRNAALNNLKNAKKLSYKIFGYLLYFFTMFFKKEAHNR